VTPPRPLRLVTDGAAARGELAALDDEALAALVAAAHAGAFAALVERHLGPLARWSAKFLGSARGGEEVAQEVLLELWNGRDRYRAQGKLRIWLVTLARNRCRNRLRDERRRSRLLEGAAEPPGAASAGAGQLEQLLEAERRREVREALLVLSPKLREAVLLRFDQELSYAEIARIVGTSEANARSRVFLGLRRLRERLGKEAP
jgi:RNA polymerase sigma-70 factor (ECF subfamily)